MLLNLGITLILVAVALVVVLLFHGFRPALPLERRRPPRADGASQFSRFAGTAVDSLDRYLSGRNVRLYNREALELAGLKMRQADYIVLVLAGGCVGALLGMIAEGPVLAILLFLIAPVIGHFVLKYLTGKRRQKFDEQLGDTLQLLSGGLRAGHSILRAIDAAATESAAPTSEEMRRVVTETSLGRDLLTSLNDIAERMENEDFVWIAQAIQINREVGGNLAEVLDQVGETIRERSEIKGQIRALAAEGKFSAYILVAMPFGIVGMLLVVNPKYMSLLFTDPLGWILIGVSVVMMVLGSLWLRKIIDLKF